MSDAPGKSDGTSLPSLDLDKGELQEVDKGTEGDMRTEGDMGTEGDMRTEGDMGTEGEEDRMEEEITQEDMRARRLAKFDSFPSQSKPPLPEPHTDTLESSRSEEQFSMEIGTESSTPSNPIRVPARAFRGQRSLTGSSPGSLKARTSSLDAPTQQDLLPDEVRLSAYSYTNCFICIGSVQLLWKAEFSLFALCR